MNAQPTVFIVDDDPAMRDSLGFLIGSVGRRVETYASAEDFL
ncbi:MAG: two-component system response regulator FixJ, partial [Planctomycetota bacterium]